MTAGRSSKSKDGAKHNSGASEHRIGIYLAYQPNVKLEAEGLGRYLAMLLSGFSKNGARIPVLCPSWSKPQLMSLLNAEGVDHKVVEIISPRTRPLALAIWTKWSSLASSANKSYLLHVLSNLIIRSYKMGARLIKRGVSVLATSFVRIYSASSLIEFLILRSWLIIALGALVPVGFFIMLIVGVARQLLSMLRASVPTQLALLAGSSPQLVSFVPNLYDEMLTQEHLRMKRLANTLAIKTWYCPTAFWPEVSDLPGNVVVCLPDLALADYPIEFAQLPAAGNLVRTYDKILETIGASQHFITYSEAEKAKLLERFGKKSEDVHVLHHAPISLSKHLPRFLHHTNTSSFGGGATYAGGATTRDGLPSAILDGNFEFIFYPSQIRPNKNVPTLLKAFAGLRAHHFPDLHLVLTGNLQAHPKLMQLAVDLKISEAVFSCHKISLDYLALAYTRASATVSPTLSEGGFPFTFAESVSCHTPIVMSSIPVVLEAIGDWQGIDEWLFDPYDYNDLIIKIGNVLRNQDAVIEDQRRLFERHSQRDWGHVASELTSILAKVGAS